MSGSETEERSADRKFGQGKSLKFWAAWAAIAITNLAASLDATTLSVALPVRFLSSLRFWPLSRPGCSADIAPSDHFR
jgi:hypothetical protein